MKQAKWIKQTFEVYLKDDSGASAIEYGLIAALIGVGIIGGLNAIGDSQNGAWGDIATRVSSAMN